MAREKIIAEGGSINGEQVTISVEGTKVRMDIVAEIDGETVLFEVKNGPLAGYTHNQRIVYPQLSAPLPEMPGSMSISDYMSLQNSMGTGASFTPVGDNAGRIWQDGGTIINYKFIIIKF